MNYKLWAFWGSRPESTAICAARLARMFTDLALIHPLFAHWNRTANSRAAADKPFCGMPPNVEELTRVFEKGRHFKDDPPDPWPEMGYSVHAWNGRDDACGVSLDVHAGSYGDGDSIDSNSIFMEFDGAQPDNEDFVNAKVLARALVAVAEAWDANWGVIETWDYKGRKEDANGQLLRPWGGWITYLAARYTGRIARPPAMRAEPTAGGGLAIIAMEEPFTVANPAHVAALDALQQALAPIQS
jgi:hypothetical protein